jgi:hypothetical protein
MKDEAAHVRSLYTKFQHFNNVSSSFPHFFKSDLKDYITCGFPYHRKKVKNANAN